MGTMTISPGYARPACLSLPSPLLRPKGKNPQTAGRKRQGSAGGSGVDAEEPETPRLAPSAEATVSPASAIAPLPTRSPADDLTRIQGSKALSASDGAEPVNQTISSLGQQADASAVVFTPSAPASSRPPAPLPPQTYVAAKAKQPASAAAALPRLPAAPKPAARLHAPAAVSRAPSNRPPVPPPIPPPSETPRNPPAPQAPGGQSVARVPVPCYRDGVGMQPQGARSAHSERGECSITADRGGPGQVTAETSHKRAVDVAAAAAAKRAAQDAPQPVRASAAQGAPQPVKALSSIPAEGSACTGGGSPAETLKAAAQPPPAESLEAAAQLPVSASTGRRVDEPSLPAGTADLPECSGLLAGPDSPGSVHQSPSSAPPEAQAQRTGQPAPPEAQAQRTGQPAPTASPHHRLGQPSLHPRQPAASGSLPAGKPAFAPPLAVMRSYATPVCVASTPLSPLISGRAPPLPMLAPLAEPQLAPAAAGGDALPFHGPVPQEGNTWQQHAAMPGLAAPLPPAYVYPPILNYQVVQPPAGFPDGGPLQPALHPAYYPQQLPYGPHPGVFPANVFPYGGSTTISTGHPLPVDRGSSAYFNSYPMP